MLHAVRVFFLGLALWTISSPAFAQDIGNACNLPGDCNSGFCVDSVCCESACDGLCDLTCDGAAPGTCDPIVCDDLDPCTDDGCDPGSGSCQFGYNTAACDDGDACSMDDACLNGTCAGVALDADSDGYVDQNCLGTDCDDSDGSINPGVAEAAFAEPACVDGLDNDCDGQTDLDDPGCAQCAQDEDCIDSNPCNGIESCQAGLCQAGQALVCDDFDACTRNACDPVAGCVFINQAGLCDDGDLCTFGDSCDLGQCIGQPMDCSGLDMPCQLGVCNPGVGVCQIQVFDDWSPCDDGDGCSLDDVCASGFCLGVDRDCSGLTGPCTQGRCDADSGECVTDNRPDGANCDDGDACTGGDLCAAGVCAGLAPNCSGLTDICNEGVCDPASGLCIAAALPEGSACHDGDLCTQAEVCRQGVCEAEPIRCRKPDNPCHQASCDPLTGDCQAGPVDDGTPCDDGDSCTGSDTCQAGLCVGDVDLCDEGGSGCASSGAGKELPAGWLLILIWLARRRRNWVL